MSVNKLLVSIACSGAYTPENEYKVGGQIGVAQTDSHFSVPEGTGTSTKDDAEEHS